MKTGQFIDAVAEAYRVPAKTVAVYDRELKKAGLLPMGRGINAPHMKPKDTSMMTVALLATDNPSKCVEAAKRFSSLVVDAARSTGNIPAEYVDGVTTLGDAITAIFSTLYGDDFYVNYVEIQENARSAVVEGEDYRVFFKTLERTEDQKNADARNLFGIRRARGLAAYELMQLWAAMIPSRYRGCDENGMPLDLNHSWNLEGSERDREDRLAEINAYIAKLEAAT